MKLFDMIHHFLKPKELDKDLQMFENKLQQILVPVKPNIMYVHSLRQNLNQRIIEQPSIQPKHTIIRTGLLLFGGIFGSFFVVLTGLRGLISVVGLVGLVINRYKRYSQENLTPTRIIQGS